MATRVVIVGGSYAGLAAARALDADADVIVVEPRDQFIHTVGMLRALVDPEFAPTVAFEYGPALRNGKVIQDRVTALRDHRVELASGEELEADVVILATGAHYPFPAKPQSLRAADTVTELESARAALDRAERVLLIGAGPVGLELSGEIATVWPGKQITLLDAATDILTGPYPDDLRSELKVALTELGVELMLGEGLAEFPATPAGTYGPLNLSTTSGRPIECDVWFACFGGRPETSYLVDEFAKIVGPSGRVRVGSNLSVPGYPWLYAVGDVNDVAEPKRAGVAFVHAETVKANVIAASNGSSEIVHYAVPEPRIVIPLGPNHGSGVADGNLIPAEAVMASKGADLDLGRTAGRLGLSVGVAL